MNTRTKTILTTGSLGLLLAGTGAGVASAATPTIAAPTGSASTNTTTSAPAPAATPAATPAAAPAATPAKDSPAAAPAATTTPATPATAATPAVTPTPALTPPAVTPTPAAPSLGQDSQGKDSKDNDSQDKGELKGLEHGEFTVHTKTGDKVIDIQGGEVSAVEAGSVTVKSTDGFTATYTLSPTTKVERNNESTTPAQITTNDRVRVVADKNGATNNTASAIATAIRIGDTEAAK